MSLRGFPRCTLRGDAALYRIHRAANAAWWFSRDGSGRFDPVGSEHGACYLADRPLGAWVEVFRKRMLLPEDEVRERALLSVELGRDLRLADLTSRRALSFGMTASVDAGQDYEAGQRFASAALTAGFDGIRYWLRHDPAQKLFGYALFGMADDQRWPSGRSRPIPDELIDAATTQFRYRVLPPP